MGHPRPLFRLFSVFFNQTLIQFLQQYNVKMSINYTVLGFEPTSFRTWFSSQNNLTGAPSPTERTFKLSFTLQFFRQIIYGNLGSYLPT